MRHDPSDGKVTFAEFPDSAEVLETFSAEKIFEQLGEAAINLSLQAGFVVYPVIRTLEE